MQPVDNSDLAWLIISDFLADQGKIAQSEELRDSINNPNTEGQDYEHRLFDLVGGTGSERVGGIGIGGVGGIGSIGCGGNHVGTVGVVDNKVGGFGKNSVGCI